MNKEQPFHSCFQKSMLEESRPFGVSRESLERHGTDVMVGAKGSGRGLCATVGSTGG